MKCQKLFTNTLILLFASVYAFANQTIESDGQKLTLNEATICLGAAVTMSVQDIPNTTSYTWSHNELIVEQTNAGNSLIIEGFSPVNAGEYQLIQSFEDGSTLESIFKLNYLTLGDDVAGCEAQTLDFNVALGPEYIWSNGSTSNAFTITFEESITFSVSALTEFDCLIEVELNIEIVQLDVELSVAPIEGNYCQSFINLNIEADAVVYPVLIYADFQDEQTLLIQYNNSGEESIVKEMGAYTNVYAITDNGCLIELGDFKIENQGPFFEGPYMRSRSVQKGI